METMEGTMEFTLKSGNCALFFYCEGIPHMLVLNRQTVIGGCFGMEADRKKKLFLRIKVPYRRFAYYDGFSLSDARSLGVYLRCLDWSHVERETNLGNIIEKACHSVIKDDNVYISSDACDSGRRGYYKAVGMHRYAYYSGIQFVLIMLILNHITIFGVRNFRETFFRGKNEPEADDVVGMMRMRYSKADYFKAPAFYIRRHLSRA